MEIELNLNELEELIELSDKIIELNDNFKDILIDLATSPNDSKEQQQQYVKVSLDLWVKIKEMSFANDYREKMLINK